MRSDRAGSNSHADVVALALAGRCLPMFSELARMTNCE